MNRQEDLRFRSGREEQLLAAEQFLREMKLRDESLAIFRKTFIIRQRFPPLPAPLPPPPRFTAFTFTRQCLIHKIFPSAIVRGDFLGLSDANATLPVFLPQRRLGASLSSLPRSRPRGNPARRKLFAVERAEPRAL